MLARHVRGLPARTLKLLIDPCTGVSAFAQPPSSSSVKIAPGQTKQPDKLLSDNTRHTVKIIQQVGPYDVFAEYHQGTLRWVTKDKHDQAVAVENAGTNAKGHAQLWIQRRYRIYKKRIQEQVRALFLPVGYPESVKDNYMRFSSMATLSLFFMNTCTTVGSTFLLYAAGLGRAESAATASAINWIIKDGVGQAGTLVTARTFSHDFDLNTRSWYIFANTMACLAAVVEISANTCPVYFIPIASAANTLKGIAGLAGSSSRAALHVSFARGENIADITAKSQSQFIFSYLSGTVAGILVSGSIDKSDTTTAVYVGLALTLITAATSYVAIRSVPLANLNSSRMQLLLEHYTTINGAAVNPQPIHLPHPPELCVSDPVAPLSMLSRSSIYWPLIKVNAPIRELLPQTVRDSPEKLKTLVEIHKGCMHILMRDGRSRTSQLHILLHQDASPEDAIMAMFHAVLVRREIKRHTQDVLTLEEDLEIIFRELQCSLVHRGAIIESLKAADWNLSRVAIESDVSRGKW